MDKRAIIIVLLVILGAVIAYRLYNKPHMDLSNEQPDYRLSAAQLAEAYMNDEAAANDQYLGKIIEVRGEIASFDADEEIKVITLSTGDPLNQVACALDGIYDDHRKDFKLGESVVLRCTCSGKLMDVELTRCKEIN